MFGYNPQTVSLFGIRQLDKVKYLLERGANVHQRDSRGNTPLHYVDNPEIAQLLLDRKADPNAENRHGETPLNMIKTGAMARVLIENNAYIGSNTASARYPLFSFDMDSLEIEAYNIIKVFLEYKFDPNTIDSYDGLSLLHKTESNSEVIELLLQSKADPNLISTHYYCATPLHFIKSPRSILLLLQYNANPDIYDNHGFAPLHYFVSGKQYTKTNYDIVRILLQHNANPNIQSSMTSLISPGHLQQYGPILSLDERISSPVYPPHILNQFNMPNNNNNNIVYNIAPLHIVDRINILYILLQYNADINISDSKLCTPLHTIYNPYLIHYIVTCRVRTPSPLAAPPSSSSNTTTTTNTTNTNSDNASNMTGVRHTNSTIKYTSLLPAVSSRTPIKSTTTTTTTTPKMKDNTNTVASIQAKIQQKRELYKQQRQQRLDEQQHEQQQQQDQEKHQVRSITTASRGGHLITNKSSDFDMSDDYDDNNGNNDNNNISSTKSDFDMDVYNNRYKNQLSSSSSLSTPNKAAAARPKMQYTRFPVRTPHQKSYKTVTRLTVTELSAKRRQLELENEKLKMPSLVDDTDNNDSNNINTTNNTTDKGNRSLVSVLHNSSNNHNNTNNIINLQAYYDEFNIIEYDIYKSNKILEEKYGPLCYNIYNIINKRDITGNTPLYNINILIIRILLYTYQYNIYNINNNNETFLHYICHHISSYNNKYYDIDDSINTNTNNNILFYDYKRDLCPLLDVLLPLNYQDKENYTPLIWYIHSITYTPICIYTFIQYGSNILYYTNNQPLPDNTFTYDVYTLLRDSLGY